MATELLLLPQPLTAAAFAPFGTIIEPPAASRGAQPINAGTSARFEVVPELDLVRAGGRAVLALYRSQPRRFPLPLLELERHALGAQAFMPLRSQRFVVVVAPAGDAFTPGAVQAFVTNGTQGVLLHAGTWHHPLLAVDGGDYLVLERRAAAPDCELLPLSVPLLLALGA